MPVRRRKPGLPRNVLKSHRWNTDPSGISLGQKRLRSSYGISHDTHFQNPLSSGFIRLLRGGLVVVFITKSFFKKSRRAGPLFLGNKRRQALPKWSVAHGGGSTESS